MDMLVDMISKDITTISDPVFFARIVVFILIIEFMAIVFGTIGKMR